MPKQTSQSKLMAKAGNAVRRAHEAHKADETTMSSAGDLPEGIENGIAKLERCEIGEYKKGDNAGELYFLARATVVYPKEHNGLPIEGLGTQIMEALHDTPNRKRATFDDHYAWVLNELRKLGINTSDVSADDLEAAMAALVEAGTYTRFRTWKGEATKEYPNPRVNHEWRGSCNYSEDENDGVVDSTGDGDDGGTDDTGAGSGAGEEDELTALATAADGGDQDAATTLAERASKAGVDDETVENAASWSEVAQWIRNEESSNPDEGEGEEAAEEAEEAETDWTELGRLADEEGDQDAADQITAEAESRGLDVNDYPSWLHVAALFTDDAEPAEEEYVPEKGHVLLYKPPKAKKAIECEVTAVFSTTKTVNLKNMVDGKSVYRSVAWSALEQG